MAKLSLRVDDGLHRPVTWLELFFDLAFVISISSLVHLLVQSPDPQGLLNYVAIFIPVWWVWNQFTWFSSHFDNDDLGFRLFLLSGIVGTLFLTRGLHAYAHGDLAPFIGGYLFLHLCIMLGWLRAHRDVRAYTPYIRFKLLGSLLGIVFWGIAFFATGTSQFFLCATGLALQLLMPIFAWMTVKKMISIHQHHLLERHGLFLIILLGECLLLLSRRFSDHLVPNREFLLDLLIIFQVWWIYFDWKYDPVNLQKTANAFAFNYGHFFVYASIGVLAAGIALGMAHGYFVNLGVGVYLTSLATMNLLGQRENASLRPYGMLGLGVVLQLWALAQFGGSQWPAVLALLLVVAYQSVTLGRSERGA